MSDFRSNGFNESPHPTGVDELPPASVASPSEPKMWLSEISIRQPVFITMIVVAVMVVGGIFYSRLGLDLFPDVSLPIAVVQTTYPGANPEEVERSVTKPIEEAVASLNGVETVRSVSMDSISQVIVEFKMSKDGKEAVDDVRTRINTIRNTLPVDVREPVILTFDPSAAPILSFAIADKTGTHSADQLRILTDDVLKPRLEQVTGVAAVDVVGGRVREVHVDLRAEMLEAYGIAPQLVTQALRAENLDVPAGRIITDGQREELLRTSGEIRSIAQIGEIPIVTRSGGTVIKVNDVASVTEGYAETRALSRLNGQESIVAQALKQSGTNTVQVADGVKHELERLQQEHPDLSFALAFDQSTFTREAVDDVQFSLLLGAILAAVIVLVFFRDLRNTLVTIAGLPVILLGTFAVLYLLGRSLNMITLMALSLSIGMLIDDAIVVRENILRHMEHGEDPKVAAGRGTAEIALAVLAVTSTIVAVFLPIAFTEGIAGKFLGDFGLTVAVAVLISLVEAFTLAPMLSAYFFKRIQPGHGGAGRTSAFGRFFEGINHGYRRLLGWSLHHRLAVVLIGVFTFVGSLALIPQMTFSFVPESDQGEFGVSIDLGPGARLSDTDQAAQSAEQVLMADPAVVNVFTTVGSSDGAVEKATLNVKLTERGQTDEVITRIRPQLNEALAGTKFTIDRQSSSAAFGGGAAGALRTQPIQFAIQGPDFVVLDQVSAELVSHLQQVPGTMDVERSLTEGKPGQAIVLDRAKAADLGVTTAQAGATVRALVNGERVGTYRAADRDIDIIVQLAKANRESRSDILRLPIMTATGSQVPLSSIASLVESAEPNQIYRENRQRQLVVGANTVGRDVGSVQADAQAVVDGMNLPEGVTIKLAGQAAYQDEMFASLGLALGLAVMFVYMILASQFGSFIHPFTIMLALPFSIVGALLSLYVTGFAFDMLGMIGIILLMGLVTKNSILLVEFINQLRRRGLRTRDAILEAGPIRLRPIVMTTLAMIFGMIPLAAGIGAGAELRQAMGISVIGGLITSTLLTLVVVPVAYSLIDDVSRWVTGRRDAADDARMADVSPQEPVAVRGA